MLSQIQHPRAVGICPVCNGTKRVAVSPDQHRFSAGYSAIDHTIPCQNCGGQYMFSVPTGLVWHNKDDKPCTHEYQGHKIGNCLHEYRCIHCGDTYQIDSGD